MSTKVVDTALPYHEPSITTILVLTSFLLLLNVVNHVMDRMTHVGLLGQIFLGIAFGTPGGRLLGNDSERLIVNLGYLGLLLLVYEGGLTTSFQSLKANIVLASCVAITGICIPIGLSFMLMLIADATPLQAFAGGAALCSTSLGTTFTVLQSSKLNVTRLGVVLILAAMMDDIVGLVMVQVITNLGQGSESLSAVTVVRPIFVSIGFGLVMLATCRFVALPLTKALNIRHSKLSSGWFSRLSANQHTSFVTHTLILVGAVASATYAGTSGLLAAYLVGAAISWWDNNVPHISRSTCFAVSIKQSRSKETDTSTHRRSEGMLPNPTTEPVLSEESCDMMGMNTPTAKPAHEIPAKVLSIDDQTSGIDVFEKYYQQPLQRILKPFFFASIGFSIPITKMFTSDIVWRGVVYTVLMFVGKLMCGVWLLRLTFPNCIVRIRYPGGLHEPSTTTSTHESDPRQSTNGKQDSSSISSRPIANPSVKLYPASRPAHASSNPAKPISIQPALILGCAMVARGEIGFLISSLAQANGIFGESQDNPLFLIVTWAIMLCTILGPVFVGFMVKRVKRLNDAKRGAGRQDVLGVWGVT